MLSDIFSKLNDWKRNNFKYDVEKWIGFIRSDNFKYFIRQYSKLPIISIRSLNKEKLNPNDFFRSKDAVDLFFEKVKNHKIDSLVSNELKKYLRNFE
jgi:hypothetical protein